MEIRRALRDSFADVAALAAQLWPDNTVEDLLEEFYSVDETGAALFLAEESGEAVGFAQCQLRHDYVEGTDHSPVGYLEGIYVQKGFREKGIARELLRACEDWAAEQGCAEFASDCELDNTNSLAFHLSVGFAEANRVICFTKKLNR
jgi:aminoglycoside 6'-N-acetyltransferase I